MTRVLSATPESESVVTPKRLISKETIHNITSLMLIFIVALVITHFMLFDQLGHPPADDYPFVSTHVVKHTFKPVSTDSVWYALNENRQTCILPEDVSVGDHLTCVWKPLPR